MNSLLYWIAFALPVAFSLFVLVYLIHKQNSHTELYSEGLRNENNGSYQLALHNYENALIEIRKIRRNDKFGRKIADRIRILRTTIEYENNFQTNHNVPQ